MMGFGYLYPLYENKINLKNNNNKSYKKNL